jgi:N-glycosylase/DNA lyase
VSEQELFALKMGFRAKYIADACEKIKNGSVDIERVMANDNFDECVAHLCQVKGIGLKVASCALLFGFGKTEAFPLDVHINRTLEKYFPNGIDVSALGKSAGIAQQYLFYYEKYSQST